MFNQRFEALREAYSSIFDVEVGFSSVKFKIDIIFFSAN